MQALRFSSIVCVAGWLAIYFSEVGMMLLLKYFYNILLPTKKYSLLRILSFLSYILF